MAQAEWGPNPPQPLNHKDLTYLEGFTDIVLRTRSLVTDRFRQIRYRFCPPPVIICGGKSLNEAMAVANRNSTREKSERRGLAAYGIHDDCVYFSLADLEETWQKGETGRRLASLVNAHEHLHALTTSLHPKGGIRLGFTMLPVDRVKHGLEPGKFYTFDHPKVTTENSGIREDPINLRLTENATDFALHLMLGNIIPGLEHDYRFILIHGDGGEIAIEKNRGLLDSTLMALYKGRRALLDKPLTQTKTLVDLLEGANVTLYSITNPRLRPIETFELVN